MSKNFKSKNIQPSQSSALNQIDETENKKKIEQLTELYNQDSAAHFKKPLGNTRVIMLAIIIAAIFGVASGFIGVFLFLSGAFSNMPILQDISLEALMPTNSVIIEHEQQIVIQEEERVDQVVAEVSQTVVGIFRQKLKGATVLEDIYLDSQLVATGFILTEDGWVVASGQSIKKDENYVAITANEDVHPIESIVLDPISQTAWLKFEGSNLPVATLAKKESFSVGQKFIALKSLINNHVIDIAQTRLAKLGWKEITDAQSLLRSSDKYDQFIKIQDILPQDYNGSPLINLAGEFIGFNISSNKVATIENIKNIIPQVLKGGLVVRPRLGVGYLDLSQSAGAQIELVVSENQKQTINKGALVTSLTEHGPADKAGIKINDILTKVNQIELDSVYNLTQSILDGKVGDETTLTIWRAGEKEPLEVKVVLE